MRRRRFLKDISRVGIYSNEGTKGVITHRGWVEQLKEISLLLEQQHWDVFARLVILKESGYSIPGDYGDGYAMHRTRGTLNWWAVNNFLPSPIKGSGLFASSWEAFKAGVEV